MHIISILLRTALRIELFPSGVIRVDMKRLTEEEKEPEKPRSVADIMRVVYSLFVRH